jgi:hypothetical protein
MRKRFTKPTCQNVISFVASMCMYLYSFFISYCCFNAVRQTLQFYICLVKRGYNDDSTLCPTGREEPGNSVSTSI